MNRVERYRIIHNQYNFSKAVTLELFELGNQINISSGREKESFLSKARGLLAGYKIPLQETMLLFAYIKHLNINSENYDLFISGEPVEEIVFASKTYDEEKERKSSSRLTTIVIASFLIAGIGFFFLFKSCGNESEVVTEKTNCECYKWGKDLQEKEINALTKSSSEIEKVEKERENWNVQCRDKMNPEKLSDKKKLLEDLEKCK